jgi:hypothetical protein
MIFSYVILEDGPMVQILHGDNVIDECGPWETLSAAIAWADEYVIAKNSGLVEPVID